MVRTMVIQLLRRWWGKIYGAGLFRTKKASLAWSYTPARSAHKNIITYFILDGGPRPVFKISEPNSLATTMLFETIHNEWHVDFWWAAQGLRSHFPAKKLGRWL